MAAATKIIQLPAPVQRRPPTAYWSLGTLTINVFARTATALFVTVDDKGQQVPAGDSMSMSVSAERYDAAVDPVSAALMDQLLAVLKDNGQVDGAATVVDPVKA